jgi:ABC-2 type transport system ATP-binding protein
MTANSSSQNESRPPIDVIKLTHAYENHLAVNAISFYIKQGTTFGLIGPNGAGKSTTIKMLTTLLPATSGQAYVNGYSIIDKPQEVRQSIGYVPQQVSADGELTGYENLVISSKLYGLHKKERQQKIHDALEFMNLTEFKDKRVNSYSGGMIRRLEIAQALVHQPKVLFLDEPAVGLDPAARKMLWNHIKELKHKNGTTILLTTHDMDEAEELCDIVALMHLGKIVVMDTPENLKAAISENATLDDVFIFHTGNSLKDTGDFNLVRQTRRTISNM